ncbi:MAG TPA: dihydrolipoamide acetyltransferase family protein [Nevskiaceae bacterium]
MSDGEALRTFRLPDLGEGLADGVIARWRVAPGEAVEIDQIIAEVETAKSVVEVPSPYAGTVATLHAAAGETLAVGAPLISIATRADASATAAPPDETANALTGSGNVLVGYGTAERARRRRRAHESHPARDVAPAAAAPPAAKRLSSGPREAGGPVAVSSPSVRKLARSRGVNLRLVAGSGPNGRVTRADVERSAAVDADAAPRPAQAADRHIPLSPFRRTVADRLQQSRREIPEATVWVDVDATPLWQLRESLRTPDDPGPGLLAYLARFVVAALKDYPMFNARLDLARDEIVEYAAIHLGIATQGERGLTVPTVHDAGTLTTRGLDQAIRAATARAKGGNISLQEMADATFTLNNYGRFRVDGSAAIINYPQVAILGFGRILDRPWVVDGQITARKITVMSLVFDHRVCDGLAAAGFMRAVADAIENPASAIARM